MNLTLVRPIGNYLFPRSKASSRVEELNFILEKDKTININSYYILNRIFDPIYLEQVKFLLNKYKKKYIEINFSFEEMRKHKIDLQKIKNLPFSWSLEKKGFSLKEREIISYFTNLNISRNLLIEFAFENGYDFVCVLDQDCFFDFDNYNKLIENINNYNCNIAFESCRKLISNFEEKKENTEMFFVLCKGSKARFNAYLNYLENDKQEILKKMKMYPIYKSEKNYFNNQEFEECKFINDVKVFVLESNSNFTDKNLFKNSRIASLKYTCEILRMRKI
jgi:hypothetical protein